MRSHYTLPRFFNVILLPSGLNGGLLNKLSSHPTLIMIKIRDTFVEISYCLYFVGVVQVHVIVVELFRQTKGRDEESRA